MSPNIQSTLDQWTLKDIRTPRKKASKRIWFASSFAAKETDPLAASVNKTGSRRSGGQLGESPAAIISLGLSSDTGLEPGSSTATQEPAIDDKPPATESDATPQTSKDKKNRRRKRKRAKFQSDMSTSLIASPDRPLDLCEGALIPTPSKRPKLDQGHSITEADALPYIPEVNIDILSSKVDIKEPSATRTQLDESLDNNRPTHKSLETDAECRTPAIPILPNGYQSPFPMGPDTTPPSINKKKKRKKAKPRLEQSPDSQARSWSQEMKASLSKRRSRPKTPLRTWKLPSQPTPLAPKSPTLGQKRLALLGIKKKGNKTTATEKSPPIIKTPAMAPLPREGKKLKKQPPATRNAECMKLPVRPKVSFEGLEQSSPASSLSSIVVTIPEGEFSDYDPQSDWDAESESNHSLPSLTDSFIGNYESDMDE